MPTRRNSEFVRKLVLAGILTALVIILQLIGSFTTFFGPFSTAVGLIPIAIGAIVCGPIVGAWLGLVFALVVLFSGGANLFLAFDVPGTLITVPAKGIACGLAAGLVYHFLKKFNKTVAAICASVACPLANTAVFLLGCAVFFLDDAQKIAEKVGMAEAGMALFIAFAFGNFLFEIGMCTVLSPIIVRILSIWDKIKR